MIAPSGWYFFNGEGQATLALVHVPEGPEGPSYFSVRTLLDLTPEGKWSELNGYFTLEAALAFALEEAALEEAAS